MSTPELPVIRVRLEGLPAECPHCGEAAAFPLTVFAGLLQAECPACHMAVARIAVDAPGPAREVCECGGKFRYGRCRECGAIA